MNVTEKKVGAENFAKIAELGGFGTVGTGEGNLDPDSNLDLSGVLDPENKALTDAKRDKIRELAGVSKTEDAQINEAAPKGKK